MYRTLSELRDTVNRMIEQQGENAGCAAFVFTQNDVFEYNEEMTEEHRFPELFTEDVLADVGGCDYIYEQIGDVLEDSIRLRKGMEIHQTF